MCGILQFLLIMQQSCLLVISIGSIHAVEYCHYLRSPKDKMKIKRSNIALSWSLML